MSQHYTFTHKALIIGALYLFLSLFTTSIADTTPEAFSFPDREQNYRLTIQNRQVVKFNKEKVTVTFAKLSDIDIDLFKQQGVLMIKPQGRPEQIINYVLNYDSGDCNSQEYFFGKHFIDKDKIIIYQYWAWYGDTYDVPFGAQKIIYQWDKATQQYQKRSDKIYLEYHRQTSRRNLPSIEGLPLKNDIIRKPINNQEKQLIEQYIQDLNLAKDQQFLVGQQAQQLLDETRAIFKKQMKEGWPSGPVPFGGKR